MADPYNIYNITTSYANVAWGFDTLSEDCSIFFCLKAKFDMSAEFVVTFLPLEILGYSQQCFQVLLSIMWLKQQRHAIDDGYASPYYVLAKLI